MQDRALPFALPFFLIKENEMHHKLRYSDAFEISALFYGENITDEEKSTASELISRNALNIKPMPNVPNDMVLPTR